MCNNDDDGNNNNNTIQITDISTLQCICKLHNFMHIVSMQSNVAASTLSGSDEGYRTTSGSDRLLEI